MSPALELSCALKPARFLREDGERLTLVHIRQAYGLRCADMLWSKATAARLLMQMNMERAEHNGKGMKAAKRLALIEQAIEQAELNAWFDGMRLTEVNVDHFAELRTEGRRAHYHEMPVALNFNEA